LHEGKIRLLIAKGAAMADTGIPRYDRDFLLNPAKRDQIVELWEVENLVATASATLARSRCTA
jgi:hypothetical protein